MQITIQRILSVNRILFFWAPPGLLLVFLALQSCSEPFVYREKKSIPNGNWSYSDTLNYTIHISDTMSLYNLYIEFNHADTFPNQNLYLKLYTRFPDNRRVGRLRSFEFFDLEGKPLGKCSGGQCTNRILLQNNLYFNLPGDYQITLEQYTRRNPMPGISTVELLMEKTDKKR